MGFNVGCLCDMEDSEQGLCLYHRTRPFYGIMTFEQLHNCSKEEYLKGDSLK